jgi:hypothetical protein
MYVSNLIWKMTGSQFYRNQYVIKLMQLKFTSRIFSRKTLNDIMQIGFGRPCTMCAKHQPVMQMMQSIIPYTDSQARLDYSQSAEASFTGGCENRQSACYCDQLV